MNHIYRLVWNRVSNVWQVVSELATQSRAGMSSTGLVRTRRWTQTSLAILLGLSGVPAAAACHSGSPADLVLCPDPSGISIADLKITSAENIKVTTQPGATAGAVTSNVAVDLTGPGITVLNHGTIDAGLVPHSFAKTALSAVGSNSVLVQNAAGGVLVGVGDAGSVAGLFGFALSASTQSSGSIEVNNAGTMTTGAIPGVMRAAADRPVAALYGGGRISMTNTGAITGRVGMEASASGQGNIFYNAGLIEGSVSMGQASANTFMAITGSQVTTGNGLATQPLSSVLPGVEFAVPGVVDGGAGGNNLLVLSNVLPGATMPGSTAVTAVMASTYRNFTSLNVAGGQWALTGGALASGNTRLEGGTLELGAGGTLGSGNIWGLGGALTVQNGVTANLNNIVLLSPGERLSVGGGGDLNLTGAISGSGALIKDGSGTVTLAGAYAASAKQVNAGILRATGVGRFDGDVYVAAGVLDLSSTSTAGTTLSAGLDTEAGSEIRMGAKSLTVHNSATSTVNGSITGTGGLSKMGAGTLVLNGDTQLTGGTTVSAGTLRVGGTSADSAASLASRVTVQAGGVLGGYGSILDRVTVLAGGTLSTGAAPGQITIHNGLTLSSGSTAEFNLNAPDGAGGSPADYRVSVMGDLSLEGANLRVVPGSGYAFGLYRLFNYTGALSQSDGGLKAGVGEVVRIDAATKSVNLINTSGLSLDIWNANGLATPTSLGGGSGTWSNVNANWTDPTALVTGVRAPADGFVVFGGAPGTVTVSNTPGVVKAQGMQFASDGYRLNGDSLQLVEATPNYRSEIRVGDGSSESAGWTATIDNVLTGNRIDKTGAGTLVLNGNNEYVRSTRISQGVLSVSADANLGVSTGAVVFNGGILRITGTDYRSTTRNFEVVSFAGFDIADPTHTFTVNQAFSGPMELSKRGAGTLELTAANTFTGRTVLRQGTLALTGAGAIASNEVNIWAGAALDVSGARPQTLGALSGDGTLRLGSNALTFNSAQTSTFAGGIAGEGSLFKNGTGTLTLDGEVDASALTVSGGTLAVGRHGSVVGIDTLTMNGGVLDLSAAALHAFGALQGAGGKIIVGADADSFAVGEGTYSGEISGSGGLFKFERGVLALNGQNTYTGPTVVGSGTLMVGGGAANASASLSSAVTVGNSGVLGGFGSIGGDVTVQSGGTLAPGALGGVLTVNGALELQSGSRMQVTVGAPGTPASTPGAVHSVQVNGDLALQGARLTTVDAGGYAPGVYRLFDYTGELTLANGGLIAGPDNSIQYLSGDRRVNLINTAGLQLAFWNGNGQAAPGRAGGGSGTWAQANANWADASGAFTSTRSPADGFVVFGGAAGTVTVDAFAAPVSTQGMQFITDGYRLQGDTLNLAASTPGALSIVRLGDDSAGDAAINVTVGNRLTGWGLNKTGAGTLVLEGDNAYTQATRLSAGVLTVSSDRNLGAASAGLQWDGGTLRVTGTAFASTARSLEFGSAGGSVDIVDANHRLTFAQSLTGSGKLTKLGDGTLVLGGATGHTGNTIVAAGTLQGSADNLLGDIDNRGTLVFDQVTDGRSSAVVSGTGGLEKTGQGTLTLAKQQVYSGATRIYNGTLALERTARLASPLVDVQAGATLDLTAASNQTLGLLTGIGTVQLGPDSLTLDSAGNAAFIGSIRGSGSLIKNGSGTQTLAGSNTHTGGTTVNAGALVLGTGGSLGTNAALVVNGGRFDISGAGDQQLARLDGAGGQVQLGSYMLTLGAGNYFGEVAGSGALIKSGNGVLALNGVNTYQGPTVVQQGVLRIGDQATHSGASLQSDVLVAGAATLGGYGSVTGNVSIMADGHLAPANTGGTFTINGDLMLAQGSKFDAGFGATTVGHSVQVNGDVTLDGASLNPTNTGGFAPGLYNLLNYTGTLTQNNFGLVAPAGFAVQTLTGSKQINLVNAVGTDFRIWNGNGQASATQLGGGSGVWSQANPNWADATGGLTGLRTPEDAFVVFGGASGTVDVQSAAGAVRTKGIQFASGGYALQGDAIGLVGMTAGAATEIRVGDGSSASAGWTASIANTLTGVGIDKTGAGTLVLQAANAYTGTTRLSQGVLSVDADSQLGASSAALDFQGGTLRITGTSMASTARAIQWGSGGAFDIQDGGHTFALSQSLTGGGALSKSGQGKLALTGDNILIGGVAVKAGVLQVGDGGQTGSLRANVQVDAGATLAFKRSDDLQYANLISGAGQLRQDGAGTLTLAADNTATGNTVISRGTLQLGSGGATGSVAGNIINAGKLAFNRSDDTAYAGAISGNGQIAKLGGNTLTLTGDSSAFTGTTSLASGKLQVDGSLGGSLTTAAGTVLAGTGALGSVTVGNGSLLAPGSTAQPFGRLTINGDLTFGNGALYQVVANADGQTSSTSVGGTAKLAGSVVHVGGNGDYQASTRYTILRAGDAVQGQFSAVASNLAFLEPTLAYTGKQVDLVVEMKDNGTGTGTPIQFQDLANSSNQRGVARALQSLPTNSALYRHILNLPNGAPGAAFDALSGEAHATTTGRLQGVAGNFVLQPMSRLRANLNAGFTPGAPTAQLGLGNAASLPQSAAQPLWAQVFGSWSTLKGTDGIAASTQTDGGVSVGGDHAIGGGWRLGGALGYTGSHGSVKDRASKSDVDTYSATVYGGKAFEAGLGKINLSVGAAYSWHDIKSERSTAGAGLDQTLKASYRASTAQVFTELGYAIPVNDRVTVEPFVGAGYSNLRTRGFSESGGDAALRGDSDSNDITTATLGVHGRTSFDSAGARGQLHGTVGWRHAFGDLNPASTMAFVQGSQSFTVAGSAVARDAAVVELGVDMEVTKRTTIGVNYGGQFGDGNRQHSGTLDVRYRF